MAIRYVCFRVGSGRTRKRGEKACVFFFFQTKSVLSSRTCKHNDSFVVVFVFFFFCTHCGYDRVLIPNIYARNDEAFEEIRNLLSLERNKAQYLHMNGPDVGKIFGKGGALFEVSHSLVEPARIKQLSVHLIGETFATYIGGVLFFFFGKWSLIVCYAGR